MRLGISCSSVAIVLSCAVIAHADDYTQFVIPTHHWEAWSTSVQGSWSSGHSSSSQSQQRSSELYSWLSTDWALGFDSDALQCASELRGYANGARSARRDDDPHREARQNARSGLEEVRWMGSLRSYPWRWVGLDLSINSSADFSQSWRDLRDRGQLQDPYGNQLAHRSDYAVVAHDHLSSASIDASIGVGRVRDATSVYSAQILEKRLRASGALRRALKHATRQRLAELFAESRDYSLLHERPAKYFWGDVEDVLLADGALPAPLGAFELLHLLESPYPAIRVLRNAGWFVGPLVSADVAHRFTRETDTETFATWQNDSLTDAGASQTHIESRSYEEHVLVGARAEFHRPIGMRWQVDASSVGLYWHQPGSRKPNPRQA